MPADQSLPWHRRTVAADSAYLVLVGIYLLPIWWFPYFPTQDGPAHIANAFLLKNFADLPRIAEFFTINLSAFPNWFSHLFLAGAMYLVAPLTAEKLLLSVYVLTFAGGLRYLATAIHGRDAPAVYFLGMLFIYNYSLHLGFYNFGIGLGLYFFALGFWWRHRDAMTLGRYAALNALFLVMYFVHLVPLMMALGSVLTLGVLTARGQAARRLILLLGLAPAWLLPLWYLSSLSAPAPRFLAAHELLSFLAGLGPLVSFDAQQGLARTVVVLLVALVSVALVERLNLLKTDPARRRGSFEPRPGDAFYALVLVLIGVYLLAPAGAADGAFISSRLALFPVLALLVALTIGRFAPDQCVTLHALCHSHWRTTLWPCRLL